jgi:hypothetical protein
MDLEGPVFGRFIGRYRDKYASEKHLQSDGNMPSLQEQETTRVRREPMRADFSQVAASRAAAIDAVRQNGRRFEAGSVRHTPFALLSVWAQNHNEQAAGRA